jgi:oligopeptide/dipeptide ABC transporter ATP-binding protein
MYAGSIVEQADAIAIFEHPHHPYTQGLWGAIPLIDQEKERLAVIPGTVPDLGRLPQGCKFHLRCPHRFGPCDGERPPMVEISPGHHAACYLYGERPVP